jgi:hypothetical protein
MSYLLFVEVDSLSILYTYVIRAGREQDTCSHYAMARHLQCIVGTKPGQVLVGFPRWLPFSQNPDWSWHVIKCNSQLFNIVPNRNTECPALPMRVGWRIFSLLPKVFQHQLVWPELCILNGNVLDLDYSFTLDKLPGTWTFLRRLNAMNTQA